MFAASVCVTRQIIKSVPAKGLFITASTGLAAVNIGGTTLHSFAGIGTGEDSASEVCCVFHGTTHHASFQLFDSLATSVFRLIFFIIFI